MKVLLIGDSHTVGPYGQKLRALFEADNDTVEVLAKVGANAMNYLPGGRFSAELEQLARRSWDLVIISLGTNDATFTDSHPAVRLAANMKALADKVANRVTSTEVWYVGPPAFSETAARKGAAFQAPGKDMNSRAAQLLVEVHKLFGAKLIDVRAVTKPFVNANDIHLGAKGGEAWAQAVYDRIKKLRDVDLPGSKGLLTVRRATVPAIVGLLALIVLVEYRKRRRRRRSYA